MKWKYRCAAGHCTCCDNAGEVVAGFEEDNEKLVIALRQVVAYVRRVGGFMAPEDQAVLRRARAVLGDS